MRWVEVIFGATMGAGSWLAGANLLIWLRDRRALAQLSFSVAAIAIVAVGFVELRMMQTRDPAVYTALFRWFHCAGYGALIGSVAFIHHYLGSGRRWFALLVIGVATLVLLPNFLPGANNSFERIYALQRVQMWGQPVSAIGVAKPSVMMAWAELAHVLWWLYTLDATIRLWRRRREGDRRRAIAIGGPAIVAIFFSAVAPTLFYLAGVRWPLLMSLSFTVLLVALGYELSEDVARANRTARELIASRSALRDSEQRLELVVEAAELVAWEWDVVRDEVWIGTQVRGIADLAAGKGLDWSGFLNLVHPEDRSAMAADVETLLGTGGHFDREFRHLKPDGTVRWFSIRGRTDRNAEEQVVRLRGVVVDVTGRVEASEALSTQRRELAHLMRVAMLGELSGSLAHELNQPLTSILSNAQAAQRLVNRDTIDREEFREILADIVMANGHAAGVIRRVRDLLKNHEEKRSPVDLNELVLETLHLMRMEFRAQGVEAETDFAKSLPRVSGDPVQLQQVLLNLAVNACDAMSANVGQPRRLSFRTQAANGTSIEVSVSDTSDGILPEMLPRVFEPFLTTKPQGLGLGLSVCRTIIAAHGGSLFAANNTGRGATFRFTLPTAEA